MKRIPLVVALFAAIAGCADGPVRVPLGPAIYLAPYQGPVMGAQMIQHTLYNDSTIALRTPTCAMELMYLGSTGWRKVEEYDDACDAVFKFLLPSTSTKVSVNIPRGAPRGMYIARHQVIYETEANLRILRVRDTPPFELR